MNVKRLIEMLEELDTMMHAIDEGSECDDCAGMEFDPVVDDLGDEFFNCFREHYNDLDTDEERDAAITTLARGLTLPMAVIRGTENEDRPLTTAILRAADAGDMFS